MKNTQRSTKDIFIGIIHSQFEQFLSEVEVKVWRKEVVYISMGFFLVSSSFSFVINMFVLVKLRVLKKVVSTNGLYVFVVIGIIAFFTSMGTYIARVIKNEYHLPISLFFNFLANIFLFAFILGNDECIQFLKNRLRIFKEKNHFIVTVLSCAVCMKRTNKISNEPCA